MKQCCCGPQSYPAWLRKLITKFVGFNEFCIIHDHEYTILTKRQADINFLRFLKSKGCGDFKLACISFFLTKGNKYFVKRSNMQKEVKQSVFLADFIMTRRNGKVHLIGGKVDGNEATLDGFKREVLEETKVVIKDKDISFLFYNVLNVADVPDIWNQNFFTVKDLKIENMEPSNEVSELFIIDKIEFMNMDDESLTYAAQAFKKYLLNGQKDLELVR